ncbi:hypothetical protein ACEWY4_006561 [Coilia grayii]|uniref:Uncharacterized protein n=1 Tax=Coilia grayii TaxID=363190 RepID=A0ABD1KE43_9TELE
MAVSISTDLSVTVGDDVVADKLAKKQSLLNSIEKNECKALGVSQVMLGLLIMMDSITLLFSDTTEVVTFGVPLWTGLVFVTAGSLATMIEKYTYNRNYICCCINTSAVAIVVAAPALIIYFTDIARNPVEDCVHPETEECHMHYSTLSRRVVKTTLAIYTLIHAIISTILTYILHRARKQLDHYTTINN